MLKETIILDWYKDFGIEVRDSNCAYEEYAAIPFGESKRFEHKEYAFKFSSHELGFVDLKMALERLEKVLTLEEWVWMSNRHVLNSIRFNGELQVFSLKDIDKILTQNTLFSDQMDADIKTQIQIKKERNNECPVFVRRIPWELHLRSIPIWYPDTGYREIVDFETMKKRKPTTDEIVNNASLYTRFSTGFV